MKKTSLLSTLLLALLSVFRPAAANAQITTEYVYAVDDSIGPFCTLPSSVDFYLNGYSSGTVTPTTDTVTITINFGDGTDSTYNIVSDTGVVGGTWASNISHSYYLTGTYAPFITATAIGGATASVTASPFVVNDTCAQLHGKVYVDANSNCIADPGEIGMAYTPVWVINSAAPADTFIGTWADDTGHYSLDLSAGTYTILSDPTTGGGGMYWWGGWTGDLAPSCPASGAYTVTVAAGAAYSHDFAFMCTTAADTFDMTASGFNNRLVKGDTTYLWVWAGNWWWDWSYDCHSLSTTVTLTLDPHLHYISSYEYWAGASAPVVSGSTVTWSIATTSSYDGFYDYVKVYVDTLTAIGDTLCNTIYAAPATGLTDPDLANNTSTFCAPVFASWDPNGIAVSPQGTGTPGYIANKTALSYDIHFQNTGTAPAQNITIVDTLSANADMSTLHILRSTAPVEIYTSGNIVKFRFSNINLADSAASPAASIGSIVFGIVPKEGLAPGTQIKNQASIYFDYNAPVQTNGVLNTIMSTTTGVQQVQNAVMSATVYPNPADDQLCAKTSDNSEFTMTITDITGRTVAVSKSAAGKASANIQYLTTGLYIVNLTNSTGNVLTTKVTIQH